MDVCVHKEFGSRAEKLMKTKEFSAIDSSLKTRLCLITLGCAERSIHNYGFFAGVIACKNGASRLFVAITVDETVVDPD